MLVWLLIAAVVLGIYSHVLSANYKNYEKAKRLNLEHKRIHHSIWRERGWKGQEWGAPPPPCPQCLTDVVYYG